MNRTAAWAGADAVICVALLTVNEVALVLPKFTVVAPVKPVPVIVTEVPPIVGPLEGLIVETVGREYKVTTSPVPGAQAKTGVFPQVFVPSVGNVAGRAPAFEMSVYIPAGTGSLSSPSSRRVR